VVIGSPKRKREEGRFSLTEIVHTDVVSSRTPVHKSVIPIATVVFFCFSTKSNVILSWGEVWKGHADISIEWFVDQPPYCSRQHPGEVADKDGVIVAGQPTVGSVHINNTS
jgi:hypothetical protein